MSETHSSFDTFESTKQCDTHHQSPHQVQYAQRLNGAEAAESISSADRTHDSRTQGNEVNRTETPKSRMARKIGTEEGNHADAAQRQKSADKNTAVVDSLRTGQQENRDMLSNSTLSGLSRNGEESTASESVKLLTGKAKWRNYKSGLTLPSLPSEGRLWWTRQRQQSSTDISTVFRGVQEGYSDCIAPLRHIFFKSPLPRMLCCTRLPSVTPMTANIPKHIRRDIMLALVDADGPWVEFVRRVPLVYVLGCAREYWVTFPPE